MSNAEQELRAIISRIQNRPATLTLEELSKHAGVTLRWLQELQAGKINQPTFLRVVAVRDALDSFEAKISATN